MSSLHSSHDPVGQKRGGARFLHGDTHGDKSGKEKHHFPVDGLVSVLHAHHPGQYHGNGSGKKCRGNGKPGKGQADGKGKTGHRDPRLE